MTARSLVAALRQQGTADLVTAECPVGPCDPIRFLEETPRLGEAAYCDEGAAGARAWATAGRGAALRFEASGEGRFSAAREAAARAMRGRKGLVAIGGGSFFDEAPGGAWQGFPAASFVVPRWQLAVREGDVTLRLTARREQLGGDELEHEAARVDRALERAARLSGSDAEQGAAETPALFDIDGAAFRALVLRGTAAIAEGAFEKVVLASSGKLVASALDPWQALARLEGERGARFAIERAGGFFVGATPERLASVVAGVAQVDALAGTSPRSRDEAEDAARAAALLASDKDLREHALVVDAIVSALRGCGASVGATPKPAVRTTRRLHHLHTPVRAALGRDDHVLSLVEALHPTPAVGGLPRGPALSFLRAFEGLERGWYAGPVGWFDDQGDGSFHVAIRSALVRRGEAEFFAGAGIVRGSDPASELAEILAKREGMLDALGGLA